MTNAKIDFEALRADRAALEQELIAAGAKQKGKSFHCFVHDDANPSMEIYQSKEDNGYRVKCFGCGWIGDILDVQAKVKGVSREEIIKEMLEKEAGGKIASRTPVKAIDPEGRDAPASKKPPRFYPTLEELKKAAQASDFEKGGRLVKTFSYTNPVTQEPDIIVFRIERQDGSKTFRQGHKRAEGYCLQAPPKPWPIYNRTRLIENETCIFVEGEGVVHSLHSCGYVATTTPGGAGKAEYADLSSLAGKKVYLWPDFDEVGIAHMKDIAERLKLHGCKLFWIDPSTLGLPEKGDAADLIAKMKGMPNDEIQSAIYSILEDAQPMGVWAEFNRQIQDAIDGKRRPVEWPWHYTTHAARSLLPKTITVVCGLTGGAKSLWVTNALVYWFKAGIPVSAMMLEDGSIYHLRRSAAIAVRDKRIVEDEWIEKHAEDARILSAQAQEYLSGFENVICEPPKEEGATKDVLLAWLQAQTKLGKRVIIIDPISLMETGEHGKPFLEEAAFFRRAKRIVEDSESSLILVTHPRKGAEGQTVDDVAGSAVFGRAAQTVMWFQPHGNEEEMFHTPHTGDARADYNRTLSLIKVRNAWGEREKIGFFFDHNQFSFDERGMVVR